MATEPECAGRGIERAMVQVAIERARQAGKPLRLVSSLLNLESFSLYTRLGFQPHTIYQDVQFSVPAGGFSSTAPESAVRVRLARPDEAA